MKVILRVALRWRSWFLRHRRIVKAHLNNSSSRSDFFQAGRKPWRQPPQKSANANAHIFALRDVIRLLQQVALHHYSLALALHMREADNSQALQKLAALKKFLALTSADCSTKSLNEAWLEIGLTSQTLETLCQPCPRVQLMQDASRTLPGTQALLNARLCEVHD